MRFETASIRSVLGLRFRDATTERPVTDGLQVTVRRKDGSGPPTRAVRTGSGAYVAQGLSGLRAYERVPADIPENIPEDPSELNNGDPSDPDSQEPLVKEEYLVDIRDQRGRFVPVLLKVKLPYTPTPEQGGLYPVVEPPPEEQLGENGTPEPAVYLFSAVQRPVPSGQAVIYADLVEKIERNGQEKWQPAAHALMEIRHDPMSEESGDGSNENQNGEEVWYGLADANGRVAVQLPLPTIQLLELSGNGDGDGQGGGGGSLEGNRRESLSVLSGREVPIEIRVYSDPDLSVPERAPRPLMKKIMSQHTRDPRPIFETPSTQTKVLKKKLTYGEPLVLTTGNRSVLRIAPSSNES